MGRRSVQDSELSTEEIIDAAIALLDEHGLDGFTMRSLGTRLGRSAMAPYRHIASRDALLRAVVAKAETAPPDLGDGPWHQRLEALIRDEWTHTWPRRRWRIDAWQQGLLDPRDSRRLPATQQVYRDAGFRDSALDRAVLAHWSFIVGTLHVVAAMSATTDHLVDASATQIFEFNLGIYVAGVQEKAAANGQRPLSRGRQTRN